MNNILFAQVYYSDHGYDFDIITADSLVNELLTNYVGTFVRRIRVPDDCQKFYTKFDDSDNIHISNRLWVIVDEDDLDGYTGHLLVWILTSDEWVAYDGDEYVELQDDVSQLVGYEEKRAI